MPFAIRGGVRLYWRLDGVPDRPPLVLLHSIATDITLWDAAVPALARRFRLLRIDLRGHGASDAPPGDYSLAMLAGDVATVMADAGIARAAIAGVSLGGMVAMELALRHPDRVAALALICTSAAMDGPAWADRIAAVRDGGMGAIVDPVMARFLSPAFAAAHAPVAQSVRQALLSMAPQGYTGAAAAIRDMAVLDALPAIGVPTLVIAGKQDVSTPYAGHGERIVAAIPGAVAAHVNAAHLAPLEAPAELAAAIGVFLAPDPTREAARATLFDSGLANRRRVLGDAWVDRSLARRSDFTADFQAMITRIAWDEIWGRDGLDERTRRLIVIAITATLGAWEEFALHVRSGLVRDGFTTQELKEVLMQTAIYAGVPAANTAFAKAEEIIGALDPAPSGDDRP